ncbi:MAG TPA: helix-turn-helix transcriptional regulator [Acidimicrobiia bacterium]|nr:helix-turn-helix transcriptional regulator [Acidimicrobiia bacterium]
MSSKRAEAVFVISVAAELSGMHPQTLRIYERKGLIDPYRTPGGTRRYSREDIERLSLIQELTAKGLNLEGVKQVLELQRELQELRAEVAELRQRVKQEIEEVHRSYRRDLVLRSEVLPQVRRPRTRTD